MILFGTGDVLAGTGLREERVEGIITTTNGLVGGHLTIGLDAVPQKIPQDGKPKPNNVKIK